MQAKIRGFIDQQFIKAPNTKRINDLKDELYANLCDKYEDAFSKGKSEQEAFDAAVSSIGNVEELISRFDDYPHETPEERQKNAKILALCVGLFVLSVITMMLVSYYAGRMMGIVAFLVIAGAAASVLVYHMASRPRYYKKDETILEKFKEIEATGERKDEAFKTISTVLWLLTVALYIMINFTFGGWHFTWIIFLLAAAVQAIIKLLMGIPQEKNRRK